MNWLYLGTIKHTDGVPMNCKGVWINVKHTAGIEDEKAVMVE